MKEFLIVFKNNNYYHKIIKIGFASDGSYYVFLPYHKSKKGYLAKIPVDYTKRGLYKIEKEAYKECYVNNKIKLTHHISGFVQFSGTGIKSGIDERGNPKGLGLFSYPLNSPVYGPTFVISFWGVNDFVYLKEKKKNQNVLVLDENNLLPRFVNVPKGEKIGVLRKRYKIECFYIPKTEKYKIFNYYDDLVYPFFYPEGYIHLLSVLDNNIDNNNDPGFMALTGFTEFLPGFTSESGFSIGSSGDINYPVHNSMVLIAVYPFPKEINNRKNSIIDLSL